MLYSVDTQEYIYHVPHAKEFQKWKSRLTEKQYDAIVEELNRRIDGDEIHTSSWIPGSDWTGTVFQPIYEIACNENPEEAAMFFGLILWEVMLNRPEVWAFGRYDLNGVPIKGMTYFKLHREPPRPRPKKPRKE